MGLDQYAYAAARAGAQNEFYEDAELDRESGTFVNPKVVKPMELAYWRKHPGLQGWMEKLAENKGLKYDSFNGVELELTWEDIDSLEQAVKENSLPETSGFFFGDPSDDYYKQQDLEFVKRARVELFSGLKVFYNSSW